MKTISDYTIYCTPEQTRKAIELGAPIRNFITEEESIKLVNTAKSENRIDEYEKELNKFHQTIIRDKVYCIPTTEQMIGWIEDMSTDIQVEIYMCSNRQWVWKLDAKCRNIIYYSSRKEATIAAIYAALEYLTKN